MGQPVYIQFALKPFETIEELKSSFMANLGLAESFKNGKPARPDRNAF